MLHILNQFCKYFTSTFLTYHFISPFCGLFVPLHVVGVVKEQWFLYITEIFLVFWDLVLLSQVLLLLWVKMKMEHLLFFAGILNCCVFMVLTSILYDFKRRTCFTFMLQTRNKQYFIFSLVKVLKFGPSLTSLIWFLNNRTSPVNLNYEDYCIIYVNYNMSIQLPRNVLHDCSNCFLY